MEPSDILLTVPNLLLYFGFSKMQIIENVYLGDKSKFEEVL